MVKISRKKKGDAKSKVKRCDSLIRIGDQSHDLILGRVINELKM